MKILHDNHEWIPVALGIPYNIYTYGGPGCPKIESGEVSKSLEKFMDPCDVDPWAAVQPLYWTDKQPQQQCVDDRTVPLAVQPRHPC